MRALLFLLLLCGCAYLGHMAWTQQAEIEELRREAAYLRMELEELKSGTAPSRAAGLPPSVANSAHYVPHSGKIRNVEVPCPACRSTGKITLNNRINTCRLCAGVGKRTLAIPTGAKVCPTCQGMARTSSVANGRQSTDGCRVCGARGYGN